VFVDRRDRRADVGYVSLDSSGNIKTHTLMHVQKQRYKQEDFALYGNPIDIDGRIKSDMTVASAGLLNRCQDIFIRRYKLANKLSGFRNIQQTHRQVSCTVFSKARVLRKANRRMNIPFFISIV